VGLEKFQKNDIIEAIMAGGLDPRECELADDDREVRVVHIPSGSAFTLGGHAGHYSGNRVVGTSTLSWPFDASTWATVPEKVERWARDVKRDVDTPDLWAEVQRAREVFAGVSAEATENTAFTPDEQAEIATRLQEIKDYAKTTQALSAEQARILEARFDDLEAATRRVGRKDWLLMFSGVALGLIVTDLLPPDAVQHISTMAWHGLNHLFQVLGGPSRPLQLPPGL
jgi:hypothetical protein